MKNLLIGTALVAAMLGAAWYGGETWLSGKAREAVTSSPVVEAASVTPLRDPRRIGLRMAEVEIGDAETGLSAPGLKLYAPLIAPTTMTVALPSQMELRMGNAPVSVTLGQGQAHAALSLTHEMAIREAGIDARDLDVDGVDMLQSLEITARLAHMGGAAPQGSRAAYAVDATARGLTLPGLQERLDIIGPVQLWLTEVPGQPMLEGRVPPPALTGMQTQGLRFSLAGAEATLIGRIQADAQGRAEGEAALYTRDARPFIDAAVEAGLIPQKAAMLVGAMINTLSKTPLPGEIKETVVRSAEVLPLTPEEAGTDDDMLVALPPAQEGQIRLPLILKDGEVRLGPVPIGPAPRLFPAT
ncbi:DUF2125 domain-containing protein [Paracoccus xiamenensis]|uniref:DUF2125 domain-containing protein n=1 Tax=Paracoccus xiamenensis TaxID=2714901 RepID=UPI001407812C|nr:DUF2125 domain-containing protein [Paracoccus xiamenensis]NHF72209.1 DUF2125 domain-containing protein [Paracoccus xiamenensis]